MWEQIIEFLKGLGLKPPVDLTDPRLSSDDLAKVRDELKAKFNEKRGELPLADLTKIADAGRKVQAEIDTRVAVQALSDDVDKIGQPDPEEPDGGEGDDGVTDLDSKLTVPDATTGDGTPTPDDDRSRELADAAVAALASAGATQDDADRQGGAAGDNSHRPMVAAASVGSQAELGQTVSIARVGEMLLEKQGAYRGELHREDPERRAVLASVLGYADTPGYDPAKVLGSDPDANTALIKSTLSEHARKVLEAKNGNKPMTAATFCAPWDVIREIPDATYTGAPFRDAIPFVPFRHGGFTFNGGVAFSDVAAAVGIWTEAQQNAVDPNVASTWKACYDIVCGGTTTLRADNWITACVTWKVGTDLNNPERVQDVFRKVEGQRVRRTEQYLMALADPLMVNYNFPSKISAVPDFIANVITAFHHARYNQRLDPLTSYTMFLDTGVLDTFVIDRERMAFDMGDNDAASSVLADIMGDLGDYIDRVVVLQDRVQGAYGTQGGAAGNGNPYAGTYPPVAGALATTGPSLVTRYRIRIIPTAEVFAFGTGEIRTGIRQDFAMARQNKIGWFVEEAVQLGQFGTSPWFGLNMNLCPTGARVGWLDPTTIPCTVVPTLPS